MNHLYSKLINHITNLCPDAEWKLDHDIDRETFQLRANGNVLMIPGEDWVLDDTSELDQEIKDFVYGTMFAEEEPTTRMDNPLESLRMELEAEYKECRQALEESVAKTNELAKRVDQIAFAHERVLRVLDGGKGLWR